MPLLKLGLFLIIFSYWIKGFSSFFLYLENVLILLCFLYSVVYFTVGQISGRKIKIRHFKLFLLLLLLFMLILANAIFNYQEFIYIPSITYEVYKLLTPFYFIPLLVLFKNDDGKYINKLLFFFLFMNMLVLLLQHLFGVGVAKYFGILHDISHYELRGRPTGLTANANIIGVFGFFCYVYSISFLGLKINENNKLLKWLCFLSFVVVILSTSKAAMLCLFIFIFMRKINFRRFVPVVFLFTFTIVLLIDYNIYGISDKLQSYFYFITLILDSSEIKPSLIEGRLWGWYLAMKLFIDSPFGYGLGVWGDFSSRINPFVNSFDLYLDFSDSGLSHLIVEQGVFCLIYFYILFKLLQNFQAKFVFFMLLIFLMVTNYGFSQSLFYLGFWMVMVLCIYQGDKVEKNIDCK